MRVERCKERLDGGRADAAERDERRLPQLVPDIGLQDARDERGHGAGEPELGGEIHGGERRPIVARRGELGIKERRHDRARSIRADGAGFSERRLAEPAIAFREQRGETGGGHRVGEKGVGRHGGPRAP